MDNLAQKNIDITKVKAAPEGAAMLLVNIFDEQQEEFFTASFEGYESWKDAVGEGKRDLRKAAVRWQGLDLRTAQFLSKNPEDCTSQSFRETFGVETSGSFDPERKLLTLQLEEEWSGRPIAEIRVLSVPDFPVKFR